jgi:cytochrome c5
MKVILKALFVLTIQLIVSCSESPKVVEPSQGELTFKKNCKVCHAQGINGAPILGNLAMWKDRKDQPLDTLVSHAVNGFGLMPAKGGNTDLSEDEIRTTIKFMLSKLENN